MFDLDKVATLYTQLLDLELLSDRREYTEEELQSSYSLTAEEAKYLYIQIQNNFATDLLQLDKIDGNELVNYLRDGEHSNWDGWEDRDKFIIEMFMNDLKRGMFAAQGDKNRKG